MNWRLAFLCTMAGGCTYVSRGALEDKLDTLDEDGDGALRADDCDDQDPDRSPNLPEVPYDGIDNNCGGGDVLDIDGDGFPGIDLATYDGEVPTALVGKPVDCADDPALIPQAVNVFPGATSSEISYDGLDSDCDGSNDFDDDGDGWMPAALDDGTPVSEALDDYIARWGIAPAAAEAWVAATGLPLSDPAVFGDCDDRDAEVRPDSVVQDVPYDGVDNNCDHINDFDADGDGYMPPEFEFDFALYVDRLYPSGTPPFPVPDVAPFSDCLDAVDADFVDQITGLQAVPADVNPLAVEVPYDGIDGDCDRSNDYDADGDGFLVEAPSVLSDYNNYLGLWEISPAEEAAWAALNPDAGLTVPVAGDCDDGNTDVWPGALEGLQDGLDQDCDGLPDGAAFGFADFGWTAPSNPEVTRLGDSYLLLVGAAQADLALTLNETGVAIPFSLAEARGGQAPSATTYPQWKSGTNTLIEAALDSELEPSPVDVDGDAVPDPTVWVGSAQSNDAQAWVDLSGVRYLTSSGALTPLASASESVFPSFHASDIDMAINGDGQITVFACGPGRHHAILVDGGAVAGAAATAAGLGADTCFFEAPPALVSGAWETDYQACTGSVCNTGRLVGALSLIQGSGSGQANDYGDLDDGVVVRIESGQGSFTSSVGDDDIMAGEALVHAAAAVHDGAVYVAAVTQDPLGGERVHLQFGVPGSLSRSALPFDNPAAPGATPTSVAVHVDDDRVMVAVTALSGSNDTVGWVFLAPL